MTVHAIDVEFTQSGAGAIVQSAQVKLEERVSVRDFGAVGDGVAIDTIPVNKAISACSSGQTLYFPAGIYLLDNSNTHNGGASSTTPLPPGVNIAMDGGAWLKRAPGETQGVNFVTPLGDNIVQVNIDGDEYLGSMTGGWAQAQSTGIFAQGATNVSVINSKFRNLTYGLQVRDARRWRVTGSDFYRIRLTGSLFVATGTQGVRDVIVSANTFEDMGDTACACVTNGPAPGFEISGVNILGNIARNTQYRTQGFAFDIEGGFAFGTQRHCRISNNVVIQAVASVHGQGGVVMGRYTEDGEISGNLLISGAFERGDVGISLPLTRTIHVCGNTVIGFRGGAIFADGAVGAALRSNLIRNCGDATSNPLYSAVVLADRLGSTDAVFADNDLAWDDDYPYLGTAAAAVYGHSFGESSTFKTVKNLVIRGNRIRNPLGYGFYLFGFAEENYRLSRLVIEDNVFLGTGRSNYNQPIYASNIDGLSVRGNRVYDTTQGFLLSGSTDIEVQGNTIENGVMTAILPYWLELTGVNSALIVANRFSTGVASKIVTASAANLTFRENVGFKTEAWGTSAAIASGGTIAHGLDLPPTQVSIVAVGTSPVRVAAATDATHITVAHDGSGAVAFQWRAQV